MASKQAIQKAHQGYVEKHQERACLTCEHFQMDIVDSAPDWLGRTWPMEKNLRCGIGGFKVKKLSVCNLYTPKGEA